MPSLSGIAQEAGQGVVSTEKSLYGVRHKYLKMLAECTKRHVIAYYSNFLQRQMAQSGLQDIDLNGFMEAVHGIKDRNKGLDLILHTPGGGIAATEAIVNYLHSIFGNDIRCIVPQLAMSAGTMIACSCKAIVMGRQSSLGPIDPQFRGTPCHGVVEEFETAAKEIEDNPSRIEVWRPIIEQYPPTYLGECQKAIELSEALVKRWLKQWMFLECDAIAPENKTKRGKAEKQAQKVIKALSNHKETKTHDRHISVDEAEKIGLKVIRLERDDKLQDVLLSVHHTYMLTFEHTNVAKLIESDQGRSFALSAPPRA